MRFTTCVGFILLLVPARGAWCQEVFGSLQGRIVNRDRQPLGSVQVIASGPSLPGERAVVTRSDGHFSLLGLPVGTYRVRIAGIGYRAVVYEGVAVQLGRTADLGETQLEPQTVNLPELVVTGRPAIIDPTTTTVGLNLTAETFEALPTERDYRSIIALLPQANASYYGDAVNIGGSSGSENVYYIDGVNVTDPHNAAAGTSLPYNFVREIQVKEGGYEAEFGKSLGGIINVVTHSAGDRFNAEAFGFVTNHRLADDYRPGLLDAQVTAFSTYDFGLSLSGPIVRQRLSFLAAYNPSFERQDIEIPTLGVFSGPESCPPVRRQAHVAGSSDDRRRPIGIRRPNQPSSRGAVEGDARNPRVTGQPRPVPRVHRMGRH